MLVVFVNSFCIIIGSLIGIVFRKGIPEHVSKVIMSALGLGVVTMGIQGTLESSNTLLLIISLAVGSFVGATFGIDRRLNAFGDKLEAKFASNNENDESGHSVSKAFVTATLVYCVGAMAIIGALEAGVAGSYDTLFVKSIIDGISAIFFTVSLGWGVLLSSVAVLIYEGSIVLLGGIIEPYITDALLTEITAVGSVLIIAVGLNVAGLSKFKASDMIPAVFIPVIYFALFV